MLPNNSDLERNSTDNSNNSNNFTDNFNSPGMTPVDILEDGFENVNGTNLELDIHSFYENDHPPYVILFIFVSVMLGVIMRLLQPKIPIPYTVVIMLFGIIYGTLAATVYPPLSKYTAMTKMDPHWILQIFLPILLFESAFTINIQIFRKAVGQILILATCGLAVASCLTAIVAKFMFDGWDYLSSLMFGALISSTDPVAVVALLKDLGASPELGVILEGESLLNDGTAIILFNVFLALSIPNENFDGESLALESVLTVAGGPLLGFIAGKVSAFCIRNISNDSISEICITLATAYLTFYVGETFLRVSGVLAVVVLGLVLNYERTSISPETEPGMHAFWNIVTYIANTLIFALVGLTISERALISFSKTDWINLLCLYLSITLIRVVSIVLFYPLMRYFCTDGNADWKNMLVMSWGGLRGAVSLSLAMTVNRDPRINQNLIGDKVLLYTSGIVLLTLVVNGTTTARLLRLMGLDKSTAEVKEAAEHFLFYLSRRRFEEINELKQDYFLADVNWDDVVFRTNLPNPYNRIPRTQDRSEEQSSTPHCYSLSVKNGPMRNAELSERHLEFVRKTWLKLLKRSLWEQFEDGTISRNSLMYLNGCVDKALVHEGALIDAPAITSKWHVGHRLHYFQKMLRKIIGHDRKRFSDVTSIGSKRKSRKQAEIIVSSCSFTTLVYLTISTHVTAAVVNLSLNWHGHHLDENFFHENIYFIVANGVFCLIYLLEIILSISGYGIRFYISSYWNKLEIFVVLVLLVDLCLDVHVLAFGDGGSAIHKTMLRFFDVLSLLRVLRGIRLIKLILPIMGKVVESLVTHRQVSGFEIGKAFILAQKEATSRTLDIVQSDEALCKIKSAADSAQRKIWSDLEILLAERPDIAKSVKKRFAARKVMHQMRLDLLSLTTQGLLDEKTSQYFQKVLEVRMKKASAIPYRTPNLDTLLQQIPWMQGNYNLRIFILSKAIKSKFPAGHRIITAGQEASGIFVIISGVVKPELTFNLENGNQIPSRDDTVTCGDVLGEFLVLSGKPSLMTYSCYSNVQALLLPKEHVEQALIKFKHLQPLLWDIWSYRIAFNLLADQPTMQNLQIENLRAKISKGFSMIVHEKHFVLNPNWELVILIHGTCIGLPQEVGMEGPKIISNRFNSLEFDQKRDRQRQPVVFVIGIDGRNSQSNPQTPNQVLAAHI